MFYEQRKNNSRQIFSQYGFGFDSDTDDEESCKKVENIFISRAINVIPDSMKKAKKTTKKITKKTNITNNGTSVSKSIIKESIYAKFN
jgi:hypothetical protein